MRKIDQIRAERDYYKTAFMIYRKTLQDCAKLVPKDKLLVKIKVREEE